jgi:putative transposase
VLSGPAVGGSACQDHGQDPTSSRTRCAIPGDDETARGEQAHTIVAVDFLHAGTAQGLFFIEYGTLRVHVAGITAHPSGEWVTRQVRNLLMDLGRRTDELRFLIRDRDIRFTAAFDAVFTSVGIQIIVTPVRAPRANAVAERWVGSVRRECTDRLLIAGERHLRRVLTEYVDHYNTHRPHHSLAQQPPERRTERPPPDNIRVLRRDRLAGLTHEHSQADARRPPNRPVVPNGPARTRPQREPRTRGYKTSRGRLVEVAQFRPPRGGRRA